MEIEVRTSGIEDVTMSDILASWDRQRSTEELRNFVCRRSAELSSADLEL
jgi:hypothetical protein